MSIAASPGDTLPLLTGVRIEITARRLRCWPPTVTAWPCVNSTGKSPLTKRCRPGQSPHSPGRSSRLRVLGRSACSEFSRVPSSSSDSPPRAAAPPSSLMDGDYPAVRRSFPGIHADPGRRRRRRAARGRRAYVAGRRAQDLRAPGLHSTASCSRSRSGRQSPAFHYRGKPRTRRRYVSTAFNPSSSTAFRS